MIKKQTNKKTYIFNLFSDHVLCLLDSWLCSSDSKILHWRALWYISVQFNMSTRLVNDVSNGLSSLANNEATFVSRHWCLNSLDSWHVCWWSFWWWSSSFPGLKEKVMSHFMERIREKISHHKLLLNHILWNYWKLVGCKKLWPQQG